MIEKKCSCERQMIAAFTAGAILALIIGFVLGWVWDKRVGALSNVSIISVLTAVGTCGAAGGAVWVAYAGQKWRRQEEALRTKLFIQTEVVQKLQSIRDFFEAPPLSREDGFLVLMNLERELDWLRGLNIVLISILSLELAQSILRLKQRIEALEDNLRIWDGVLGDTALWFLAKTEATKCVEIAGKAMN